MAAAKAAAAGKIVKTATSIIAPDLPDTPAQQLAVRAMPWTKAPGRQADPSLRALKVSPICEPSPQVAAMVPMAIEVAVAPNSPAVAPEPFVLQRFPAFFVWRRVRRGSHGALPWDAQCHSPLSGERYLRRQEAISLGGGVLRRGEAGKSPRNEAAGSTSGG